MTTPSPVPGAHNPPNAAPVVRPDGDAGAALGCSLFLGIAAIACLGAYGGWREDMPALLVFLLAEVVGVAFFALLRFIAFLRVDSAKSEYRRLIGQEPPDPADAGGIGEAIGSLGGVVGEVAGAAVDYAVESLWNSSSQGEMSHAQAVLFNNIVQRSKSERALGCGPLWLAIMAIMMAVWVPATLSFCLSFFFR